MPVWTAAVTVGGGRGARSEDQWTNRRVEMAPCGSVGCNTVIAWEVATQLLVAAAAASRGLRWLALAAHRRFLRRRGFVFARSSQLVMRDDNPTMAWYIQWMWRGFLWCLNGSFQCQGSISQDSHPSPTTYVDPRRQQFVCHHSSSSVGMGTWIWAPSSHVFPNSLFHALFHAEFVVQVELMLLRFNDQLYGQLLLSMGMLTPKFMTQVHTSILCHHRGGNRRGLPVYQALCMPKEAQGRNRRGIAAPPVDLHLLRYLFP
uniref:DUF3778 domain-containing protein n=1 Tax=Oryza meridionalis TaxID=40149 RepID=A0A0E0DRJ8_9ORYZ